MWVTVVDRLFVGFVLGLLGPRLGLGPSHKRPRVSPRKWSVLGQRAGTDTFQREPVCGLGLSMVSMFSWSTTTWWLGWLAQVLSRAVGGLELCLYEWTMNAWAEICCSGRKKEAVGRQRGEIRCSKSKGILGCRSTMGGQFDPNQF